MSLAPLNIVCIGGGTGMPQLLAGLKVLARAKDPTAPIDLKNVVAIVSAFDDGGSSGRLMQTYDTLPPGDLRNCLVALADEQLEPLMTRFLNHRFGDEDSSDPLSGHSVGNLLLLALAQVYDGDMRQALLNVGRILPIQSRILFPSLSRAVLCARLEDGTTIRGESQIGRRDNPSRIDHIFLQKRHGPRNEGTTEEKQTETDAHHAIPPMEGVIEVLDDAHLIAMGPGSLYTSVLPHLLVDGIADALARNAHKVVYVCNIMNEPGETDGFSAVDFIEAFEKHGHFRPGYVLVNNAQISEDFYRAYSRERLTVAFDRLKSRLSLAFDDAISTFDPQPLQLAAPEMSADILKLSEQLSQSSVRAVQVLPPSEETTLTLDTKVISTDLLGSREVVEQGSRKRVIRHDPDKLARELVKLAVEIHSGADPN